HQALDIFVVPRVSTQVTRIVTPMKSVEASASGKPVIASDLPALAELVNHEKTGLLVPAEDTRDRKSTRLNSSHVSISYAVFCLNLHLASVLYPLSLHDALPISSGPGYLRCPPGFHTSDTHSYANEISGSICQRKTGDSIRFASLSRTS